MPPITRTEHRLADGNTFLTKLSMTVSISFCPKCKRVLKGDKCVCERT
jgi:hypothetical protein